MGQKARERGGGDSAGGLVGSTSGGAANEGGTLLAESPLGGEFDSWGTWAVLLLPAAF